MLGWGGRSLGKYETLKRQAEEQNKVKDDIHQKFTNRSPGDRLLSQARIPDDGPCLVRPAARARLVTATAPGAVKHSPLSVP